MARRKLLTPHELDLASIAHALSADKSRPHLCSTFGIEWRSSGYLCATDGHRAAMVRSDQWQEHIRNDAPPLRQVLDGIGEVKPLGALNARALDDEPRVNFPRNWDIGLTLGRPGVLPRLRICVTKGSGRKIFPFGRDLVVNWGDGSNLEALTYDLELDLRYMLDAIDLCGTGLVEVWHAGDKDPVVFLPYGAKSIEDADRIAVVMPRRR